MQTEHKEGEREFEGGGVVSCPNCRAELPAGIRFCRRCGFRLGEGLEEYNETRRFDGARPPYAPPAAAPQNAPPYAQPNHAWTPAPMAPMAPMAPLATSAPAAVQGWRWTKLFTPWRWGWVGWVVLSLVIMAAVGAMVNDRNRGPGGGPPPAQRSYIGADSIETADGGGAMLTGIAGPDNPMHRAGLIGGDVIKSADGKEIRDADDLRRLLRTTPPGRDIPVSYVRDGQAGATTLRTGTREESDGTNAFDQRPGGRGVIGIDRNDLNRVHVPGLNIFGVKLGDVHTNRPADIAGLKEGDVVIEFNGHPVRTPGDLRFRIAEAAPGETVKVVIVRAGQVMDVMLKMGKSRDDD